jgi:hypothetical protein
VSAAQAVLGALLLATATALICYSVLDDFLGVPSKRFSRPWTRPLLLLPLAIGLIFAGGLVLRD